jgi:glucokinase
MNEDKYTSIYGVDLKAEFRNMLHEGRRCAPIEFLHDVQSFLAGLAALDPSFRSGKILAITLGTGIGCALLRDGAIVPYGPDFIDKAVGRQPWGAGKLEDLIGGKALLRRFKERENAKPVSSVKEIALLAKDGDATALAHFEEFGEILGEAMRPLLRKLAVDALVFGGQIANSYELLETAFLAALGAERPKRIFRAAEMERAALAGAVYLAFNPKG